MSKRSTVACVKPALKVVVMPVAVPRVGRHLLSSALGLLPTRRRFALQKLEMATPTALANCRLLSLENAALQIIVNKNNSQARSGAWARSVCLCCSLCCKHGPQLPLPSLGMETIPAPFCFHGFLNFLLVPPLFPLRTCGQRVSRTADGVLQRGSWS